mmetsp:Transcript_21434/g.31053  ORF Transcript_21434/g.31053 Transcript_21434/m.31053 type:complete len:333 (+) Transcript_21434:80-1078(+)
MNNFIESDIVKRATHKAHDITTKARTDATVLATRGLTVVQNSAEGVMNDLVGRLDQLDSEIANHYLDGLKYGLAGSDGSFMSNYTRYYCNHHEILAIFCADKRNPYSKTRRFLSIWSKSALSFMLLAVFKTTNGLSNLAQVVIVVLVMSPFGLLIEGLSTCAPCHRANYCVLWGRRLGAFFLWIIALFTLVAVILGVFLLSTNRVDLWTFVLDFLVSILLDQLSPIYLGIFNWLLQSWGGMLCLPQFYCCGHYLPSKFLPILTTFPVQFLLGLYHLGESTYAEDKELFEKQYPDRVAVDKMKDGSQPTVCAVGVDSVIVAVDTPLSSQEDKC